jgi:hypothetical protein
MVEINTHKIRIPNNNYEPEHAEHPVRILQKKNENRQQSEK